VGSVTLGFAGPHYCRNHSTKLTCCRKVNIPFFQDVLQPKYGSTFIAEKKKIRSFHVFGLYTTHIIFLKVFLHFLFAPLQLSSQKLFLGKKNGEEFAPSIAPPSYIYVVEYFKIHFKAK
jgi:hypothetical protein